MTQNEINTLIGEADSSGYELSDMLDGVISGNKPNKKFRNMRIGVAYNLLEIYEILRSECNENPNQKSFKKAWSLITDLDTPAREDYVNKKVYSILEKYFAGGEND